MFEKYTIDSCEEKIEITDFRPEDTFDLSKEDVKEKYRQFQKRFAALQELLYASKEYSLLIILQGMDCSGKDGTVKRALSKVNPNGFYVEAFKAPTPIELGHDYLWRAHQKTPAKGNITVFNRSYYEDVLITRVHETIDDKTASSRFEEIRNYEKYLTDNDTVILKFFLHISADFQQKKLEQRLKEPEKNWKFSEADLKERKYWDSYQRYYSDMLSNTSTDFAPWHIIPANHRWFRDYLVLCKIVCALETLDLKYPILQENVQKLLKDIKNMKL